MREFWRAALVIARRDFAAVIFSKTFIFFLLGPLFPVVVGVAAGHLGDDMANPNERAVIGVLLDSADARALLQARQRLLDTLEQQTLPALVVGSGGSPQAMLGREDARVLAVLSGSLEQPVLTGRNSELERYKGDVALLVSAARAGDALRGTHIDMRAVTESEGAEQQGRMLTGRTTQVLLFLLTMLLAGMVLSNLVEEKTNKVIEILAAAVPIDAVFVGKLMAMLGMSLVGITIWGSAAALVYVTAFGGSLALPAPAVGWLPFVVLGILYFSMAYLLLGSLFIGIGAQATTVREVQTLSMPVTMGQVVVFFLASFAVNKPGSLAEWIAAAFPLSSPFTMISRAAQFPELWPHVVALGWQILWVGVIIRIGVRLFRRNVLKSGSGGGARPGLWKRMTSRAARVHL